MPPKITERFDITQYPNDDGHDLHQALLNGIADLTTATEFVLKSGKVSTSQTNLLKMKGLMGDLQLWKFITVYDEEPANPGSNPQLGEYLTSKGYRLPLTSTGRASVSAEVLGLLAEEHPEDTIWEPLLKMRRLEKLQGTYVTGLLDVAWVDGTVHPNWHQAGTATGRWSTSSSKKKKGLVNKRGPALQTIPRPDTIAAAGWKYNPRSWYIARPGKVLCVADLSQAEVRMLAVMSQDPALIAVCQESDVHAANAKTVQNTVYGRGAWDRLNEKEQKDKRTHAKTVTFGTMYGIGATKLAEQTGLTYEEAEKLLTDFYTTFQGVAEFKRREAQKLSRTGYVTSLLGRRRSPVLVQLPPRVTAAKGTKEFDRQIRQELLWQREFDYACKKSGFDPEFVEEKELNGRATRQAINFEIQGSVAEVMNYGVWRLLRAGWAVIGQVHDEVIVELDNTEQAKGDLTHLLEEVYEITLEGVPFKLDINFGSSWAAGKE